MREESLHEWNRHNELEKVVSVGIHGAPELKREEKSRFLGEFRERVIKRLTKAQVLEPGIYQEVEEALKDKRAKKIIIHGDIPYHRVRKYEALADKQHKDFSAIHDPGFKGDTGLVVVSGEAVDIANIDVQDRENRLAKLGIPRPLIQAAGKKICRHCLKEIVEADPREVINYTPITFGDHFWGERCPACELLH